MNTTTLRKIAPAPSPQKPPRKITRGRISVPHRIFIFGVQGVGKSSFAAGAPSPLFVSGDRGTESLDIARDEPDSWDDFLDAIRQADAEEFRTLVIDPIGFFEPMCWEKILAGSKWSSIVRWEGGYGKGHEAAVDLWRVMVNELERKWREGMHIVITAHAKVKSFNDPNGPAYDRYEADIHAKAAGLIRRWCAAEFFATHETTTRKEGERNVGVATGHRVIHTTWNSAWDAKNRLGLPPTLPLSWEAFDEAARSRDPSKVCERIENLLAALDDEATAAKARQFVAEAKGDVDRLEAVANTLTMKLESKEQEKSE